jgi:hypothetical protein
MHHPVFLTLALAAFANMALAADWSHYANAAHGFAIDIPPGFSTPSVSVDGDGATTTSQDGQSELRVWSGFYTEYDFENQIASDIRQDKDEGWTISDHKRAEKSASWVGRKGDWIFYEQAVPACRDTVVYFSIDYPSKDLVAYKPIIERLATSLQADHSC